jgi:hypothetical protein
MKTTRLMALLVGLATIVLISAEASAYYHPATGRFLQRDPGRGAFLRLGTSGPSAMVNFTLRDSVTSQYADGMSLYQYGAASPINRLDYDGLLSVCCRRAHGFLASLVTHCHLSNQCSDDETPSDVWADTSDGRTLDDGKKCSCATKGDIRECLKRNRYFDNPYPRGTGIRILGGEIGNNCQTSVIRSLGSCCLKSNWEPSWYAGNIRGRWVEKPWWDPTYAEDPQPAYPYHGWEFPNWQEKEKPNNLPFDPEIPSGY